MKLSILFRLFWIALSLAWVPAAAVSQELVKQMVKEYRQSVVYLDVSKTTNTGAVFRDAGTGFIVSTRGHVITSCHVVDKVIRDTEGNVAPTVVDKVTIQGATASKAAPLEPVSFISCAQAGIDVALLKFANTAVQRRPVTVAADQLAIGDELAAMGFALNTEFFARPGTLSSETELDTLLVAMVLNPGDSGAPVFNNKVRVIGIAEAGYGGGAGIGVIRPMRHAVNLLAMAGINIFAVGADIPAAPMATDVAGLKVYSADAVAALKAFSAGVKWNAVELTSQRVTYPVFRAVSASFSGAASPIDIQSIPARPGYKITDAKFIVTESSGVNIVHIGPNPDGSAVRAAFEKTESNVITAADGQMPYIKGFIETTQEKLAVKQ